MAQQALGPGTAVPRRRAFFGLLDANGWGWATVKSFVWLIIIIFMLGYLPDRAYYLTVARTVELGVLVWSPINLCPPSNETLPCPAPVGAIIPWQPSPAELNLPAPRTDGSVIQVGTQILYIGGSDGTAPTASTYVARTVGTGNFDKWADGPALPAPRANASVVYIAGSIYVIGGTDASGAPTDTVFVLSPDSQTGALGDWSTSDTLKLKEPRTAAAAVVTPDGLLLIGGRNANGPVATTWKTLLNDQGGLGAWSEEQPLLAAQADATGVLVGDPQLERPSRVVMPDLGRIHPVPPALFAGPQQEVDGRAARPGALGHLGSPCLRVPAAFGVRLESEQGDHGLGIVHGPRLRRTGLDRLDGRAPPA